MGWGVRTSRTDARLLTALDRFLARRTTGNLEELEAALVDYRARTSPAVQIHYDSGPQFYGGGPVSGPGPGPGLSPAVAHQLAQDAYTLGRRDERRRR